MGMLTGEGLRRRSPHATRPARDQYPSTVQTEIHSDILCKETARGHGVAKNRPVAIGGLSELGEAIGTAKTPPLL